MGAVLKGFCMVTEIIWPPRLRLRMEDARVKNMLPSYTLIPDDLSDSELEAETYTSSREEHSREGGGNTMEATIRVHIKDDQQDATLDISQIAAHGRNKASTRGATHTRSVSSQEKGDTPNETPSKKTPSKTPVTPSLKHKK
ncbi:hypothetical protein OSTOST_13289 [Ostertagia ostertagi]